MTDKEMIKDIKEFQGEHEKAEKGMCFQIACQYQCNIDWLLEYVEDMSLPVSPGTRQIASLKKEVEKWKYLHESEQANNGYAHEELRKMQEKYEPEPDWNEDDMGDPEPLSIIQRFWKRIGVVK